MNKKALITGIGGQDGSYLSEYLLSLGYNVYGIVRRNSVCEHQWGRLEHINDKVSVQYGDLLDIASLEKIVKDVQPDEVYNLAAQSHVRISFDIPQFTSQTNALGVLNLLEVCKTLCPNARIYQASSSEMFGNSVDDDKFQRLTTPMTPVSPYGCSKLYAFNICKTYRESYNMHICNGILFNHESPRRGSNFVTNKVVKAAVRIKMGLQDKLELGNMDSYRDWGHSKDYVRAMHSIINYENPRDWVVSTGETNSVREMCDYVFKKLNLDYKDYVVQNPKFLRPNELNYLRGDSTEIREKLGWKPDYNFEQLMDDMIASWANIYNMKSITNNNFIMQHRPTFEQEEADACYKYMLDDTFITEHKKTSELESMICKYLNCKNCIMTTSGTNAIILALMSLELNIGDEVIVPNYTMIATINAVKFLKLVPVIVDVDKDTFTLDYEEIEKNITDKTKAVMHVSLNNRYTNMDNIVNLCNNKNIVLLEDSAQSLGCRINGKNLGTFGKIGCFSLSTPKIISTGQGGFCVTDDDEIARKINMIKNFGRRESGKDNFEVFGINLKFTDLQAVIGIEQMKKIDNRVKRMREIYDLYYENLKDHYEMKTPLNDEWIPWFVDIYVDDRDSIISYLKEHNIQTRPVYGEINKTNIYYSEVIFPNSNYVCSKGLFLPSYITLTNAEILNICNLLIKYNK
tara:strand:+ start:7699 stop:9759 length:2061 start_codon:yes stop_codon:yes gene_type:complete